MVVLPFCQWICLFFSVFSWIKIQQGRGEIFPGVGKKLWNHHDCQKCQFLMHFIWLLEPRRTECHLNPWCWWKSKSLSSFEKMHWSWSWVFLAKFFFWWWDESCWRFFLFASKFLALNSWSIGRRENQLLPNEAKKKSWWSEAASSTSPILV